MPNATHIIEAYGPNAPPDNMSGTDIDGVRNECWIINADSFLYWGN